jgi:hypothetical protein
MGIMTTKELIGIIHRILKTDVDLDFLLKLTEEELETLVACIRNMID